MTYLVDTDVVIGFLKGKTPEVSLLKTLSPQGISISLITFGEIYEGIFYGRNPEQNEQVFRQFLQDVDVLPLTKLVMRPFAKVRGHLRKSGAILADMDLLIGATALQYNLTLKLTTKSIFRGYPVLLSINQTL